MEAVRVKRMDVREGFMELATEILGSFLIAIGIYNFAVNANFPLTGFSGISLILYRLFHLPIGMTTILLNIPVTLLCYRMLGRKFLFRSLRCMVISSLMIDYLAPLLPVYGGSRLLAAICTGIFEGLGYAMIYMKNSSTGGADFIIMAVKAWKPYLSLGKIAFVMDFVIILLGGLVFRDVDGVIYGLIVAYLLSMVVDKVMYGIDAGKLALIVTEKGKEVTETIDACSQRGSTILKGQGGYRQEEKQVVMCACNNKQMYSLQKAIKEVDPKSFIIILESNEVLGEGFKI
ncbi:MAG: YitT family protein [Clostridiales bacterium]|nr:YitT family protein [Clostridiales bacterium]